MVKMGRRNHPTSVILCRQLSHLLPKVWRQLRNSINISGDILRIYLLYKQRRLGVRVSMVGLIAMHRKALILIGEESSTIR